MPWRAAWFNPLLLELVLEEFDLYATRDWRNENSKYETTRRSLMGAQFGPASQLYFGIVNSGWFATLLSQVTGVEDLIPDVTLYGGGLHETRNGGKFGIHRDFDRQRRTGLRNEMVFITYLNKGWKPEWRGALELWDKKSIACVTKL
jgi:Rps23 Pro-64 3,4-dihydroxylase Tpa1-like proline 4-hydroxylase